VQLNLLRTLVVWSLSSSESVAAIIKDKYKQQRHPEDENQPLSVQPWGLDGDKRRYFLIQGLDDTSFRIYREGNRYTKNAHWYSVAGSIDEAKALSVKLEKVDGTQAARRLSMKITNAIPMFEATEEKRNRRIYRQQRRAAFTRPEPGYGMYEGRTRGKRLRYTYDDDDDDGFGGNSSDTTSARRSTRHQSTRSTPFEAGPTFTASGRQIKQPRQGDYGESLLSTNVMSTDELGHESDENVRTTRVGTDETDPVRSGGRITRNGGRQSSNDDVNLRKRKHVDGYHSTDELIEEEDVASEEGWNSDKTDVDDKNAAEDIDDEDSEQSEEGDDEEDQPEPSTSLIVKLKVPNVVSQSEHDTPPTSPPGRQDDGIDGALGKLGSEHERLTGKAAREDAADPESSPPANHCSPQVVLPRAQQHKHSDVEHTIPNGVNGFVGASATVAALNGRA
jgi:hypothetical protein